MPNLRTRCDTLREYLTGAVSDGGTQTNPNLAFGNYRSATEAISLGIAIASAINNLTVDYASGGCAVGVGILTLTTTNTVTWQEHGGTQGTPVLLASNGSQAIVESGSNPGSYLRVTRTSASNLSGGPAAITLSTLYNNFFGFDNVASADALAGINEYRATMVRNEGSLSVSNFTRWLATLGTQQVSNAVQLGGSGAGTISTTGSFADWPSSGWCQVRSNTETLKEIVYYPSRTAQTLMVPLTGRGRLGTSATAGSGTDKLYAVPGVALGKDAAGIQSSGSAIQTIANATTSPTGITWNKGISLSEGLVLGNLDANQEVGIWVWRDIPAGTQATPSAVIKFMDAFDSA